MSSPDPPSTNPFPGVEGIIITMDDLLSNQAYISGVETRNKEVLKNINFDLLKQSLVTWASTGFPDSTNIYSFQLETPNGNMCSNGVARDSWEYLPFLLNLTIGQFVAAIQSKLSGINISYSLAANPIVLHLHATK